MNPRLAERNIERIRKYYVVYFEGLKIMETVSLQDLPSELLLSLLDMLSFADLVSMSMVNKSIRAIAVARLYSTVEASWAVSRTPPVILLLRSILNRPKLAGHIRILRLVGDGFQERPLLDEPPAFPATALPLAKAFKFIKSTGVPFAHHWEDELRSGTVDAIVALLIAMLPNLTSLHLDANFTVRTRLCGGVLHYSLCEPLEENQLPSFQHLRLVKSSPRMRSFHHFNAYNTPDVLPFFYLPNLKYLSVSIDNPVKLVWPSHVPTPSSIVSLDIYRLRESRIGSLLAVLRGLQKLQWYWLYQPDLDKNVSKGIVELDTAASALNLVRDTLTDLTIDALTRAEISAGGYDPPPLEFRASFAGIAGLGKLRVLCAPWAFFMGFSESPTRRLVDALPPSLQLLTLTSDLDDHEEWEWEDDSVIDAIKSELANEKWSLLANLRRITLPIPLGYDPITDEQKWELERMGAGAGLDLSWTDA